METCSFLHESVEGERWGWNCKERRGGGSGGKKARFAFGGKEVGEVVG